VSEVVAAIVRDYTFAEPAIQLWVLMENDQPVECVPVLRQLGGPGDSPQLFGTARRRR
jgi:hypothetical protein